MEHTALAKGLWGRGRVTIVLRAARAMLRTVRLKVASVACAVCLVAVSLLTPGVVRARPQIDVAPPQAWIIHNSEGPAAEGGKGEHGSRALLYDRQVLVAAHDVQSYTRWVQSVSDASGRDALSQVNIEFDGDASLVLHHVRVQRAGVTLDQLKLSEVRVAQRESRLEQQVYDGRKTAILFVSDLRVGDVLDYAYTVRVHTDPSDGKFHQTFPLGLTQPIDHLRLRLIAPSTRPLADVWHGPQGHNAPDPKLTVAGKQTEYLWDLRSTPGYKIESSAPAWYSPLPWIQVSEFTSWAEVAHWAQRVVTVPARTEPEIRRFLGELAPGSGAQGLLKVVRFVQDDVRYVGIETGLSRTQAAAPVTVLERRYGDCKDKSGLLIALLRAMGVQAYPMLVNSEFQDRVYEWGPTPDAFDHVIVMIEAEGGPYWVDATRTDQGDGMKRFRHSEAERGLVLRDDTTQLTATGLRRHATPPRREIADRFTLSEPQSSGEAQLESVRVYFDDQAETMRRFVRSLTPEDLSKLLLGMLRQDYPQAREVAPPKWHDDRESNKAELRLQYALPKLWSECAVGQLCTASLPARPIADLLDPVPDEPRSAPLALRYPLEVRYRREVNLPFELVPESKQSKGAGPGFEYIVDTKNRGKRLETGYGLRMNAEMVSAAKLADHRKTQEELNNQLVSLVSRRRPVADGVNWPLVALTVAVALLGALSGQWYGSRQRRAAANGTLPAGRLKIEGGLKLLGLGLVLRPFSYIKDGWPLGKLVFSNASWDQLTHPLTSQPEIAGISLAVLLMLVFDGGLWTVLIPMFFRKRREFRKCFVAFAFVSCGLGLLALLLAQSLGDALDWSMLFQVVVTGLWIDYVWRSERPAATFVR